MKHFILSVVMGALALFGIAAPQTNLGNTNYVQTQYFTLAGSGASLGATTLVLSSFKNFSDGTNLTMADFGLQGFGTVEPNNGAQEESIVFTGVTQNSNGTASLTGVSNCGIKYPYTQTSGLSVTHPGGVKFVISNTACFYNTFANQTNTSTITAPWTYNVYPSVSSSAVLPALAANFATKAYVDGVGAGGFTAANVSNTQGTFALGTSPETVGIKASSTQGAVIGADGKFYQKASSTRGLANDSNGTYITTTANLAFSNGALDVNATTTPTANKIPIANASGTLAMGWGAFGGTGADGALSISSGTTTIDLGGLSYVTKNYSSISITGTGNLAFTNASTTGTVVVLKSRGNITLTCSNPPCVNVNGIGATTSTSGNFILDDLNHAGSGKTAGATTTMQRYYTISSTTLFRKSITIAVGSGGANGVDGQQSVSGKGLKGLGGAGGGGLYIECAGFWNFTTANGIAATGINGTNGTNGVGSGNSVSGGSGGGGGSGGFVVVLYNYLTANTGTVNTAGGSGGSGGSSDSASPGYTGPDGGGGAGGFGAGGIGGTGASNGLGTAGANGTAVGGGGGGGAGAATTGTAAAGGSGGASGNWVIAQNTELF